MLEKHRWQKRYHRVIVRSAVSKIFENLMNDKLFRYLEKLNLVSDFQYGFRNSLSTVVLLTVVTERIDRPFNIFNDGTMLYNPTCPHHTYCTPIKQILYFWVRSQHSLNPRFFSKNTPHTRDISHLPSRHHLIPRISKHSSITTMPHHSFSAPSTLTKICGILL